MSFERRHWVTAPRMAPLLGVAIGAVGGGLYWVGAQLWPASIAVVLSMLATELLGARSAARLYPVSGNGESRVGFVFVVLVKYNALMALSAASLPMSLPENLSLGVIMIAGQACSRALAASGSKPAAYGDLSITLAIGFAPALLMGVPGLIGLAAAIIARIGAIAYTRRVRPSDATENPGTVQQLTEVCFYLGAVAARAYV